MTVLEGLREAFPDREIRHAPGRRDRRRRCGRHPGRPRPRSRGRCRGAVPRRSARDEWRGGSRGRPDLPGRQPELAKAVLDLGKPVVVVLSSGRPIMAPWLFERADAVLATWFLGSEAGHAVGDVLSGRYNPSGRLPVSWPVDVGQIPIFYARAADRAAGRSADHYTSKYLDLPVEPLFPFGHGLSYARFAYA